MITLLTIRLLVFIFILLCVYVFIYIYICVCVCVRVRVPVWCVYYCVGEAGATSGRLPHTKNTDRCRATILDPWSKCAPIFLTLLLQGTYILPVAPHYPFALSSTSGLPKISIRSLWCPVCTSTHTE